MQTFLPLATKDFTAIANVLDKKRLFKQALEACQILLVLLEIDKEGNYRSPKGWVNHPAVKMWRGSERMLYVYARTMLLSSMSRDRIKADKMLVLLFVIHNHLYKHSEEPTYDKLPVPIWMDIPEYYEAIAKTHRQALLTKEYDHYKQFEWAEDNGEAPDTYEYLWPIPVTEQKGE